MTCVRGGMSTTTTSRLGRGWTRSWKTWGRGQSLTGSRRLDEHVSRDVARSDESVMAVKVMLVRIHQGRKDKSEARCRLVAHKLGYQEVLDELFAGNPSLAIVKMLLSVEMERNLSLTVLDICPPSSVPVLTGAGQVCRKGGQLELQGKKALTRPRSNNSSVATRVDLPS